MTSKTYIVDRVLHWVSALLLLYMLMNLSSQLHNVDWEIKGQLEHRQDAVEFHAIVGIFLVFLTIARLLYPYLAKSSIKRVIPISPRHAVFIKVTHIALYACIFLLAGTGLLLVNNYEIPLHVLGADIDPDRDAFYSFFPANHDIHMVLKKAIGWLIAIHFAGVIYAHK